VKVFEFHRRAQAGPEELVDRALLASLDALYATARRLAGAADVAEDLVQETAKKALKKPPAFRDERGARAWLFRILINTARDHFRRRRLWEDFDPAIEELDAPPGFESIARATVHDVRAALAQLKPASRAIVILIDLEEFTLAETAEMLGVPIGTVASRLARARTGLRKLLASYETKSPEAKSSLPKSTTRGGGL
jgi:RNA polymerase sigma-70 factor (ECF subfamily)